MDRQSDRRTERGPAQYETQETLASQTDEGTSITTTVEVQCRIRDDGSKSRPFVRVKTDFSGRRTVYCNPAEARVLYTQIGAMLEQAEQTAAVLDKQYPPRQRR